MTPIDWTEIERLWAAGLLIEALRLYREATGAGLGEDRLAVLAHMAAIPAERR